jgi:hypothetical protein
LAEPFRSLGIAIESSQAVKDVPVRVVAHILDQLQTVLYHVGDSIAGGDFRVRGHPQEAIIEKCDLVFKEVRKGSFTALLALEDQQTTLTGQPSLGEDSLRKLYDIIGQIETVESIERQTISDLVKDPLHRTRILNDLDRLWPEEGHGYDVTIKPPNLNALKLHTHRKFYIKELLAREGGQKEKVTVKGVLHNISSYPNEVMKIIGPDGSISLPMESIETATKYFNKPIIALGEARFDAAGNVSELVHLSKIQPFTQITINRVFSQKAELQLSQPLQVNIDWQYKQWVMKNDDLNIIAMAKDYEECLKEFYNQFFFVWREYALADDNSLSPGARNLKKRVQSLVKEQPHF